MGVIKCVVFVRVSNRDPRSGGSSLQDAPLFAFGVRTPTMHVTEGEVELVVPEQPESGVGDAVFFNPVQEFNRDLTVAVLRAHESEADRDRLSYLDANAATGARGVRAANAGYDATLCDHDADAAALCRENLARNDLDGRVEERNANALMHEERFDVVDLDPFGTPIPFADAAFRSAADLVCVTATDTAPLCGAHRESGVRSYSALPQNTEYHAEMGLRVLLGALVRTAARYDVAATPVLSHVTNHYVRTYLSVSRRATDANAAVEKLGYIHHCFACLDRESERGLIAHPPDACPTCGESVATAGPVWLGPTHEAGFVDRVRKQVTGELGTASRAFDLLATLDDELDIPTHYDQHRLCRRWGRSANAMDEFLGSLREAGYRASRAQYGGTTFKTDVTVEEIEAATDGA